MSGRLVAAMILTSSWEENPSSWLSSSSMVRWTSLSPDSSESRRVVPGGCGEGAWVEERRGHHGKRQVPCRATWWAPQDDTQHPPPQGDGHQQRAPIASISSMKMMAGDFSRARAKASRTILAPSPMNIWTRAGPASFRKVALVCAAHARAISVLPVPGGPCRSTPLGGLMPSDLKRSLCVMGRTMASRSSWICEC